jgi:hypothetical protein
MPCTISRNLASVRRLVAMIRMAMRKNRSRLPEEEQRGAEQAPVPAMMKPR